MAQTYTGTVKEVGGVELGKSGNEKPRKIVISDSPDYQGKTFRIWGNDPDFGVLSQSLGKTVTVEYEPEEVQMGDKKWTSNKIVGVLQEGGNGQGNGTEVRGSAPVSNAAVASASAHDWSVPKEQPVSKDDYWEQRSIMDQQRSLEMEAAWAVKCVYDVEGANAASLTDDQVVEKALHIAILKRRIAAEMAE